MSRAVLVTGASRGIGRAVALAFARSGDRVAVHHRDSPALADAVVAALPGAGHAVVSGDLASAERVQHFVDDAAAQLGGLDVVVNNAGVYLSHPSPDAPDGYAKWQEAWRRTLDVNLFGAANVVWCALRHMGTGGRIVNVSSRGAFRGEPQHPAYGASKAALNAFSQSMAVALAPRGIAVTVVAPGFVSTDMAAGHLASPAGDAIRAQSPFGRVAEPEEIAAAVHWLASPQAEWASGTVVDLNGASYLRT
ncbi:NAD-dependent epimerase [Virgisporangium aliadipatigenens]|uniref:NAD-dependent epimerase n=1 Tax=Virgisporangium aliadipatigenens TaxID=741659 RepID=A0A8J3YFA2_9ACTN|nr:SDR family oxidoreductase [Virgisporangium aliadipatigenens]GIJ43951.1 NAD-dependent epimerase [Virgisporangium aliadipatigenens]